MLQEEHFPWRPHVHPPVGWPKQPLVALQDCILAVPSEPRLHIQSQAAPLSPEIVTAPWSKHSYFRTLWGDRELCPRNTFNLKGTMPGATTAVTAMAK